MFDVKTAFKDTVKAARAGFDKLPEEERTVDAYRRELLAAGETQREKLLDEVKAQVLANPGPLLTRAVRPAPPPASPAPVTAPAPAASRPFDLPTLPTVRFNDGSR